MGYYPFGRLVTGAADDILTISAAQGRRGRAWEAGRPHAGSCSCGMWSSFPQRTRHLTPVPLYQDPAAPLVSPVMRYPVGMMPRWLFPTASDPDITLAVPIVISRHPHMVTARARAPTLNQYARRRDADVNLGHQGRQRQRADEDQSEQSLQNHNSVSCSSLHDFLNFNGARTWPYAKTRQTIMRPGRNLQALLHASAIARLSPL